MARRRLRGRGCTFSRRSESKGHAKLTKPPTPWLPAKQDWRADRVLEPWKPLVRHGETVGYWNGEVRWNGPLPVQLTSRGQPLLAGPIRLVTDQPSLWDAPRMIEEKPYRVIFAGRGVWTIWPSPMKR